MLTTRAGNSIPGLSTGDQMIQSARAVSIGKHVLYVKAVGQP